MGGLHFALRPGDRTPGLRGGYLVADGRGKEIFQNPGRLDVCFFFLRMTIFLSAVIHLRTVFFVSRCLSNLSFSTESVIGT